MTEWKTTSNYESAEVGRFTVRVFRDATWTAYDETGTRVVVLEGPTCGQPIRPHTHAEWDSHGFRSAESVDEAKAEAISVMSGVQPDEVSKP